MMCLSPKEVPYSRDGLPYVARVPCRECWQCRASRVNDLVGRSLAEASCSLATCAITLTYRDSAARDVDLADRFITKSHWQRAVRSLRKRGHGVRYLVAGEYGDLNGRAHFHALLFFSGQPPEIAQGKRDWVKWWPHGHVFGDWSADERAVRYVCKYVLKGGVDSWLSFSKKPPLGHAWFAAKAAAHIRDGVVPRSFDYVPPGGKRGRVYTMTGTTRRNFAAAVRDGMLLQRPELRAKLSEWFALTLERLEYHEAVAMGEEWAAAHPEEYGALFREELDRRRMSERQGNSAALEIERRMMDWDDG